MTDKHRIYRKHPRFGSGTPFFTYRTRPSLVARFLAWLERIL